ncbi:hypothetical protein Pmani_022965 [Petrolisthes manimaculis]|uniref:Uncharacterized protein n=1 Tax=Petrolisthes manimaculis TaxID=1843537 RepID=A0AAE1U034_9EUCA|nr:hypothetical protein Pmani_022965 [Petrolisthes manimaculis]
MATRLGLRGNDIELSMTKVGNVTENYYSKEYCLPLSDKQGNVVSIRAVGIKEISSTLEPVDVSKLVTLFEALEDHIPSSTTSPVTPITYGLEHTIKEERELALIDKGLKYDANNKLWTAHYPWIKDPKTLSNNVAVAIAKMKPLRGD